MELALETAKVSLFAADSTRARNIRAPDGYPKRTGTERHCGRQFSSTGKLIELAHGAMKWRDAFKTEAISTAARPPMYQCRHRPKIYTRKNPACAACWLVLWLSKRPFNDHLSQWHQWPAPAQPAWMRHYGRMVS